VEQAVRKEWLSYADAEKYCGLSRVTLWRLVRGGQVRAARVGRSVRLDRRSLQQYMESAANEHGE
jgi:excisionase family DNA binding protein